MTKNGNNARLEGEILLLNFSGADMARLDVLWTRHGALRVRSQRLHWANSRRANLHADVVFVKLTTSAVQMQLCQLVDSFNTWHQPSTVVLVPVHRHIIETVRPVLRGCAPVYMPCPLLPRDLEFVLPSLLPLTSAPSQARALDDWRGGFDPALMRAMSGHEPMHANGWYAGSAK